MEIHEKYQKRKSLGTLANRKEIKINPLITIKKMREQTELPKDQCCRLIMNSLEQQKACRNACMKLLIK